MYLANDIASLSSESNYLDVRDKVGEVTFGEFCEIIGYLKYRESRGVDLETILSYKSTHGTPPPSIKVEASQGLGDTVAKITKATGLDRLSEIYTSITGKPCGCAERQEALNKLFPYNPRNI